MNRSDLHLSLPIEDLLTTISSATMLVEDLTEEELTNKESPEKFSALEILCHLRDFEVECFGWRIKRILEEDRPYLPDLDGARLAVERQYNHENVEAALLPFGSARRHNVEVLRKLSSAAFLRAAVLHAMGDICLAELVLMMAAHDEHHLENLQEIRSRVLASRT